MQPRAVWTLRGRFWNWRVQISNVIYWNLIGPYLENFVIKLIPRIYCFRIFQPYTFNDVQVETLGRPFHSFDFVFIHECFWWASSMNRSIVILNTIIIIWEVHGNDWPQTTVQIFNVFCCIYCPINFSQSTDAIVCSATLNHDTDFSVYTGTYTCRSECFITFSPNRLDCQFQSQFTLVRKKSLFSNHQIWQPSFLLSPRDLFFPVLFTSQIVFSSCMRTDDTPSFE